MALLDAYRSELERRWIGTPGEPANGRPMEEAERTLTPPDGAFLIARRSGRAVGCVGLRRLPDGSAEVKRMYVPADERGAGLGRRLLAAAEQLAEQWGVERVRLDTRGDLVEARGLYLAAGYREIDRYNDNPYAEHWFEKVLHG